MTFDDDIERIREEIKKESEITLKIAFFGQPGAGKSSLINKLVNKKIMKVGSWTDTTTKDNSHDWNGLKIVDLPGYGTTMFPKDTYFDTFDILSFDLFICVFSGKFHQVDIEFFQRLKGEGKACLFVRNKRDDLWEEDKTIEQIEQEIMDDLNKLIKSEEIVYFTSCRKNYGLSELSEAISNNLDFSKQSKWVETSKAYSLSFLNRKKKLCEHSIYISAGLSAANGANPIPGLDVGVDITVLVGLFYKIRDTFGLSDELLKSKKFLSPFTIQVAHNIIKYASKEGVIILLKKYVQKVAGKEIAKYIPFVGPFVAASIGFGVTLQAGNKYLEDCYSVAKEILDFELGHTN